MLTRQAYIAAAAVLDLLIVAGLAVRGPTDGPVAVVVALTLAPVGTFAVASLARAIDPRRWFAAAAATTYAVLPLVGSHYFLASYRHTYASTIAPALVGLRSPGTFAAGIAAVVLAAVVPRRLGLAVALVAAAYAALVYGFSGLADVKVGLHESAWSITFLEWLLLAGVLGTARRSAVLAITLAAWLFAVVLWGANAGYADGAFWRALAAALPAAALLLSSLVFLLPPLRAASVRAPGPAR